MTFNEHPCPEGVGSIYPASAFMGAQKWGMLSGHEERCLVRAFDPGPVPLSPCGMCHVSNR